jgi:hypothetical protein
VDAQLACGRRCDPNREKRSPKILWFPCGTLAAARGFDGRHRFRITQLSQTSCNLGSDLVVQSLDLANTPRLNQHEKFSKHGGVLLELSGVYKQMASLIVCRRTPRIQSVGTNHGIGVLIAPLFKNDTRKNRASLLWRNLTPDGIAETVLCANMALCEINCGSRITTLA